MDPERIAFQQCLEDGRVSKRVRKALLWAAAQIDKLITLNTVTDEKLARLEERLADEIDTNNEMQEVERDLREKLSESYDTIGRMQEERRDRNRKITKLKLESEMRQVSVEALTMYAFTLKQTSEEE